MASHEMRKCRTCGKRTQHIRRTGNHVLHFILSVLTVGLWLFVWLLVALSPGPPYCVECGTKNSTILGIPV